MVDPFATRTAAELPLEVATDRPLYQRISQDVSHLRALGLSLSQIAAHLGVTDKTAAKALAWADNADALL